MSHELGRIRFVQIAHGQTAFSGHGVGIADVEEVQTAALNIGQLEGFLEVPSCPTVCHPHHP
jgi:hypothetical protein